MSEYKTSMGWAILLFVCQAIIDVVWIIIQCILSITICRQCTDFFGKMIIVIVSLSLISLVVFYSYCLIVHYIWDKDTVLRIHEDRKEIEYVHGGESHIVRCKDVEEMRCGGRIVLRIHMLQWVQLYFKDGSTIYITWFLCDAVNHLFMDWKELGLPEPLFDSIDSISERINSYIPH